MPPPGGSPDEDCTRIAEPPYGPEIASNTV
jgi:hypothetical protein